MAFGHVFKLFYIKQIPTCLTSDEMAAIKVAYADTPRLSYVISATNLRHKLPAVAAYLRVPQDKVVHVIKHNVFTTAYSFLQSQGYDEESTDSLIRRLHSVLGMSFATGTPVHRLALLIDAYESFGFQLHTFTMYPTKGKVKQSSTEREGFDS
jgi:hypothetical protein